MEFESSIVRCHSRWFRADEFISGEFISLRVKKAVFVLSSLHFVLERGVSRVKKSIKFHLSPLKRRRKPDKVKVRSFYFALFSICVCCSFR